MLQQPCRTPPSARSRQLLLQTALGSALIATKGEASPEVEQAYARARELCQQVEDVPRLFTALWGLRLFYAVQGELHTARELGEQLLTLAQRVQDPLLLVGAHQGLGTVLFDYGELLLAQAHLQQGITLSRQLPALSIPSLYIRDPGMVCHAFAALTFYGVLAIQSKPGSTVTGLPTICQPRYGDFLPLREYFLSTMYPTRIIACAITQHRHQDT